MLLCRESIRFALFSESEISKAAEVQVWRGVYYDANRKPIENGLLDPRMVCLSPPLFVCVFMFGLRNGFFVCHWLI